MYIRQTRMNYSGICGETISFDPSELIETGLDLIIGAIPYVGDLKSIYDEMTSVFDTIELMGGAFNKQTIDVDMNNEDNIYTYPNVTKQRQNDDLAD